MSAARVAQVVECHLGARVEQLLAREGGGAHTDRPRSGAAGGLDVQRRVADEDRVGRVHVALHAAAAAFSRATATRSARVVCGSEP